MFKRITWILKIVMSMMILFTVISHNIIIFMENISQNYKIQETVFIRI